jgi:hypothetical protein
VAALPSPRTHKHAAALLGLELVFARIETVDNACKLVGWPETGRP